MKRGLQREKRLERRKEFWRDGGHIDVKGFSEVEKALHRYDCLNTCRWSELTFSDFFHFFVSLDLISNLRFLDCKLATCQYAWFQ